MQLLNEIDSLILNYVKELNYQNATTMFLTIKPGKKLRSKLLLKIAQKSDESIKLAAIVEMIHAASLLHDDVIDSSDTRRGSASTNALFGSKNAIMLGDILYSKAYSKLVEFDKDIAQTISESVCKISVGELMDVLLSKEFNEDKKLYLDMIYHKTAALIEGSTKAAAILAGLDAEIYAKYGKNLGIAFQIVDDWLDVTQSSQTLGKPAFSDFKEGKTTLPYIYLYERLDNDGKKKLKALFKKELNSDEILFIKDKFKEYKIDELVLSEIEFYANEAISAVRGEGRQDLIEIIESLVNRNF